MFGHEMSVTIHAI